MDPFALQPVAQHVNFNGQIAAVFQQHLTVAGSKTLLQIAQQRQIICTRLGIATAAIDIGKFHRRIARTLQINRQILARCGQIARVFFDGAEQVAGDGLKLFYTGLDLAILRAQCGVTHRDLTTLDDATLRDELARSREALSELIGQNVAGFAYPYGRFDGRVARLVREAGYEYACSCLQHRTNHTGDDPYRLSRIEVNQDDDRARFASKLAGRYARVYRTWYRWHGDEADVV